VETQKIKIIYNDFHSNKLCKELEKHKNGKLNCVLKTFDKFGKYHLKVCVVR